MRFVNELKCRGLDYLLEQYTFKWVTPFNTTVAVEKIKKCIGNNGKICIRPDCDCDGYMAALAVVKTLDAIGYTNYTVMEMQYKNHCVTYNDVIDIVKNEYDLVIIVDSSSNAMDVLKVLADKGVDTLVLDHHTMDYEYKDYPKKVVVVNPCGEGEVEYNKVSGCFVTCCVMKKLLEDLGYWNRVIECELYCLGYITIYSDTCSLENVYNLSIVQNVGRYSSHVPREVSEFMTKYDTLCRNFVDYKFAPRINAQIRMNKFKFLHRYLYYGDLVYKESIEGVYRQAKEVTSYLVGQVQAEVLDEIVIANLDTLPEEVKLVCGEVMRNFTGLVASEFNNLYHKPCLCIMDMGEGYYEGSIREPFNRNLLKYFKVVTEAGGHPSAFGCRFSIYDLESILTFIQGVLERNKYTLVETININGDNLQDIDTLIYDSKKMAEYNELCGLNIPPVCISKRLTYNMRICEHDNYTSVQWGDIWLTAFVKVYYGAQLQIQPTISGDRMKYYINNLM